MAKFLMAKIADRSETPIKLNITEKACRPFGFLHGEKAIGPTSGAEVIMQGVAKNKEGIDVLWYEIIHPRMTGLVCYYEGAINLEEAGFKKVA
jgi:hypothetical protein